MPLADDLRATLILPVPEAEPVVGHWRQQLDPPAPFGIPAHITVLFPFRPMRFLGAAAIDELRAFFQSEPGAQYTLGRVGRFPGIVYLAPEPPEPFIDMTARLSARFGLLPYGRAGQRIRPHLTVARHDDPSVLDALEAELTRALPLSCALREAWLMERDEAGFWHRAETFPFGPWCHGEL